MEHYYAELLIPNLRSLNVTYLKAETSLKSSRKLLNVEMKNIFVEMTGNDGC